MLAIAFILLKQFSVNGFMMAPSTSGAVRATATLTRTDRIAYQETP